MECKFTLLTILVASVGIAMAQNYCSKSLCGNLQHIACNNNGTFAARCTNPTLLKLTKAQNNIILQMHNNKRNQVAGGQTKLQPACRMATMQWDDELARIAAFNVKQCQMRHDACRNTNTFRQSGQNLVMITFQTGTLKVPEMLRKAINLWYNEISNVQMSQINSYPSGYNGPAIGHFTVMVADRNIRVGCDAATYKARATNMSNFLMACNYATTNIVNRPIYNTCATAASGCTTGKNTNYPNLCSTSEPYSV
ncbi:venom allergen-1-like [Eurosta solidaginis]|uniref:venom allergen-1-like n=1 Tax=Eurosta solidaginis TaxID=178769 RepID=UPI003530625E